MAANPSGAASQPAGGGAHPGLAIDGETQFRRACAACHGLDGSGAQMRAMLPKIGDLTAAETHARMDDAAMTELITKGRGKMPPLGGALNPDQINAVIAYVRTLKK